MEKIEKRKPVVKNDVNHDVDEREGAKSGENHVVENIVNKFKAICRYSEKYISTLIGLTNKEWIRNITNKKSPQMKKYPKLTKYLFLIYLFN